MADKGTAQRLAEKAQFEQMCERVSEFLGKSVDLEGLEERFELDSTFGSKLEAHIQQRLRWLRAAIRVEPFYGVTPPAVSNKHLGEHTRHLPEVDRDAARRLPKLDRSHWQRYLSPEFPNDAVSSPLRHKAKRTQPSKHAQRHKSHSPERITAFYKSYDWKRARYEVLLKAKGRCMCCKRDDTPLNVDHIKPVKKYWSLRLDPNNLQVLCGDCNHGKGNWDETDWRPAEHVATTEVLQNKRKALRERVKLVRQRLLPKQDRSM